MNRRGGCGGVAREEIMEDLMSTDAFVEMLKALAN